MEMTLFIGAIVIVACVLCNRLANRIGMPLLIVFIGLGMMFGSDGLLKIPFDDFSFAEQICSAALIFIMFYGGFGTKWSEAKPVALPSVLLSSLGTVLTAILTGLICWLALGFSMLEGMLIGAVLSSTDAASVFSILRTKKLNLKYRTASMLEMESGSNDPFAYMLSVIILAIMGGSGGAGLGYEIFAQLVFGVAFGFGAGFGASWLMKHYSFEAEGFEAGFIFAVAVLAYAVPVMLGGNGYLSTYLAGIILGNARIASKKKLVHFFDGLTTLMQVMIFFLLGLLSFPSQMLSILPWAIAIALILTFAVRPLVVTLLLKPFRASWPQIGLVSWAGLRGASSIVFAIMVTVSPVYTDNDVFHIVFCVVLFSILLQGSLLPWMSEKLAMVDLSGNVLRTFNDYSEETEAQFICTRVSVGHPWDQKSVRELAMPEDILMVMIRRDGKTIIPQGGTRLRQGDEAVLCASQYQGQEEEMHLVEILIDGSHAWKDKKVNELNLKKGALILLIRRDKDTVIPRGSTRILEGDLLVIREAQESV